MNINSNQVSNMHQSPQLSGIICYAHLKYIINQVKNYLNKIDKIIDENAQNDYQQVVLSMVSFAQLGRYIHVSTNRKKLYYYFIYNQDILQEISNYTENQLLKLFERIIKTYQNEKN